MILNMFHKIYSLRSYNSRLVLRLCSQAAGERGYSQLRVVGSGSGVPP